MEGYGFLKGRGVVAGLGIIGIAAAGCLTSMARSRVPLPSVPPELKEPAARAAYVARHYWDAVHWDDVSERCDTLWFEESFADYSLILGMVDHEVRDSAVSDMLEAAARHGGDGVMCHLARLYLYDTASPVWNEEGYVPFAAWQAKRHPDDERVSEEYRAVCQGREGSGAPDMELVTRDGDTVSLSSLWETAPADGLTVLFYAPGCADCHEVMGEMARRRGNEPLVAVYIGEDVDGWREDAARWPSVWTVAMAAGECPYEVRRTPVRYSIGGDGIVLKRVYGR